MIQIEQVQESVPFAFNYAEDDQGTPRITDATMLNGVVGIDPNGLLDTEDAWLLALMSNGMTFPGSMRAVGRDPEEMKARAPLFRKLGATTLPGAMSNGFRSDVGIFVVRTPIEDLDFDEEQRTCLSYLAQSVGHKQTAKRMREGARKVEWMVEKMKERTNSDTIAGPLMAGYLAGILQPSASTEILPVQKRRFLVWPAPAPGSRHSASAPEETHTAENQRDVT